MNLLLLGLLELIVSEKTNCDDHFYNVDNLSTFVLFMPVLAIISRYHRAAYSSSKPNTWKPGRDEATAKLPTVVKDPLPCEDLLYKLPSFHNCAEKLRM